MRGAVLRAWVGIAGVFAIATACDEHVAPTPQGSAPAVAAADGGGVTTASCSTLVYPAAPSDASTVRYVGACTAPDPSAPEGSIAHPFSSLTAALAASAEHTTFLVAPGTYEGALHVAKAGTRILASSGERPEDAVAVVRDATATGPLVSVDGATDVVLQGLRVSDAPGTGIQIRGGSVTLRGCTVENTHGVGHGIDASGGAIIFQHNAVNNAAGAGIIFQNVAGIIFQNTARAAKAGGIVGIGPKQGDLTIDENQLLENTRVGLALFGLEVKASGNHVADTHADANGAGDGIVVANYANGTTELAANVDLEKSLVERSARTGIIFQNQPRGIIFQNTVQGSGAGGIRVAVTAAIDDTALVRIEGNQLGGNAGFGIAVLGGRGIIFQNQVQTTTLSNLGMSIDQVGDGIAVVSPATGLHVEQNTVSSAQRAGIYLENLDKTAVVDANTLSQNNVDFVIQGGSVDAVAIQGNQPGASFDTNGTGSVGTGGSTDAGATYSFPTSFPDVGSPSP